jgi:hypothetical protein
VCVRGCDWVGVGGVGRHILAGMVIGVCAKVGVGVSDATGAGCGRGCLWGCHGMKRWWQSWCAGNGSEELGKIVPRYRMFQHQNFALAHFMMVAEVSMTEILIQSQMSKAGLGIRS